MAGRKIHIVLVEDNPGDVLLICEQFKELNDNFQFTVLPDGELAIDYFNSLAEKKVFQRPELLILDLNLPKRNGKEVLTVIKSNKFTKNIPVVVFSSSSAPKDVLAAYSKLANSYIVKPFLLDDFNKSITEIYNYWFKAVSLPV